MHFFILMFVQYAIIKACMYFLKLYTVSRYLRLTFVLNSYMKLAFPPKIMQNPKQATEPALLLPQQPYTHTRREK